MDIPALFDRNPAASGGPIDFSQLEGERDSVVLSKPVAIEVAKDWGAIFPNAACVTALIDRLTHHAEIITIAGESYRRREAEAAQKARQIVIRMLPNDSSRPYRLPVQKPTFL